jgi:hypothetical protein
MGCIKPLCRPGCSNVNAILDEKLMYSSTAVTMENRDRDLAALEIYRLGRALAARGSVGLLSDVN